MLGKIGETLSGILQPRYRQVGELQCQLRSQQNVQENIRLGIPSFIYSLFFLVHLILR